MPSQLLLVEDDPLLRQNLQQQKQTMVHAVGVPEMIEPEACKSPVTRPLPETSG